MGSVSPGDGEAGKPKLRERCGSLLCSIRRDIESVRARDPAARSRAEVALVYSGLHAIWSHRVAHGMWLHGSKFLARVLAQLTRFFTGVEIHPGASIGEGFFIDHGMGVVIGETSMIGEDVTLYHGVTLGGTSLRKGKRHPTVGDRVTIGAGAKILGDIVIGDDSRIGANAVVVRSVPENSVVVGVPGQIVRRSKLHHAGDAPDLDHSLMPDVLGVSLRDLMGRVEGLERRLAMREKDGKHHVHATESGDWEDDDFVI
ncbi:MAG: serine O-acetyltransferase [Rectinemataceae bacterium]